MDDQEFVANLDYYFSWFSCKTIKVNHFCVVLLHFIFLWLRTRSLVVPYAYVSIEYIDCIF